MFPNPQAFTSANSHWHLSQKICATSALSKVWLTFHESFLQSNSFHKSNFVVSKAMADAWKRKLEIKIDFAAEYVRFDVWSHIMNLWPTFVLLAWHENLSICRTEEEIEKKHKINHLVEINHSLKTFPAPHRYQTLIKHSFQGRRYFSRLECGVKALRTWAASPSDN